MRVVFRCRLASLLPGFVPKKWRKRFLAAKCFVVDEMAIKVDDFREKAFFLYFSKLFAALLSWSFFAFNYSTHLCLPPICFIGTLCISCATRSCCGYRTENQSSFDPERRRWGLFLTACLESWVQKKKKANVGFRSKVRSEISLA